MKTAVAIEKHIEDLSTLKKFDWYINLSSFYYSNHCRIEKYENCKFSANLPHIYVESLVNSTGSVDKLQSSCGHNYGTFYSLRILIRSLAAIERERIKLENKFIKVLEIWNALNAPKWQKTNLKKRS